MKNKLIYLLDPQSVNSLGVYDYEMIYGIKKIRIHFFGNSQYNHKLFNSNVTFYPAFSYGKYSNSICKGLSYALSIILIILRGLIDRPAILHFQWTRIFGLDYFMVKWFQILCGTKIVFTVHNILPRKQTETTFSDFKKLYDTCNLLIAHTETCKRDLVFKFDVSPDKVVVMPHGCLDLEVPENEIDKIKDEVRETYNLAGKFIFSSMGVHSLYKGTDLLLKAWCETPELAENDDLRLVIAGKPSNDISIPDNLPENVIVISRLLSNAEFITLIQISDVSVMPYREIEQSGVLLTLIQNEIPYCCTNVGELAKPFETAPVGWVIDAVTPEAISKCMKHILADKEAAKFKKNNSELWSKVKNQYSWRRSNEILEDAYLNLAL